MSCTLPQCGAAVSRWSRRAPPPCMLSSPAHHGAWDAITVGSGRLLLLRLLQATLGVTGSSGTARQAGSGSRVSPLTLAGRGAWSEPPAPPRARLPDGASPAASALPHTQSGPGAGHPARFPSPRLSAVNHGGAASAPLTGLSQARRQPHLGRAAEPRRPAPAPGATRPAQAGSPGSIHFPCRSGTSRPPGPSRLPDRPEGAAGPVPGRRRRASPVQSTHRRASPEATAGPVR